MGGGSWNATTYSSTIGATRATSGHSYGSGFAHTASLSGKPRSAWAAHDSLNPKLKPLRESRDSADHPTSTAITVAFDVTGSMGRIPDKFVDKLPGLFNLLLLKGLVEHPQIMFAAIGDATCDRIPIQVGEWESDNRVDEALTNIVLEGGGGGQMTESYELMMYFLARHTETDCLIKRGKKPYLFMLGDEMAYPYVDRHQVAEYIGDTPEANIKLEDIVNELKSKFEVFFIVPSGASHGTDKKVISFWRNLFGQNCLILDDPDLVCETIAVQIGLAEGTTDLDDGLDHAADAFGTLSNSARDSISRAVVKSTTGNGGIVKATDGDLPATTTDGGSERL